MNASWTWLHRTSIVVLVAAVFASALAILATPATSVAAAIADNCHYDWEIHDTFRCKERCDSHPVQDCGSGITTYQCQERKVNERWGFWWWEKEFQREGALSDWIRHCAYSDPTDCPQYCN